MKENFYCFDHSSVQIMNDRNAGKVKQLIINFKIPASQCANDTNTMECVPIVEYEQELSWKFITILQNRKRLETDRYDGGSPIVKESFLGFFSFPKGQLRYDFEISETLIEHEDNLFMSIDSFTS